MQKLIKWLSVFKTHNLPHSDTKRHHMDCATEAHSTPLVGLRLGPDDFFTAMEQVNQQAFPCQVCDSCAPGLFDHYGYHVADNSWCSQCHEQGECLDVALIEYYRKHHIDDDTINHTLPRTRWSSRNGTPRYQSLEDIKSGYPSVFESSRKNANAVP